MCTEVLEAIIVLSSAGGARNCSNSSESCSAQPWKKRLKPDRSSVCAELPIRRRKWRGSLPVHYSSFRVCLTRWLKRFESGTNRNKLATPSSRLHLWMLISDLNTFIPFPAGLIRFQPRRCLWPPDQNATRGNSKFNL